MAQENEVVKKLKELNEGLKQFSSSNPYDNKLKELEERIVKLESLYIQTNVNKEQSSEGKPVSKKSNRTVPIKKLVSGKSRKHLKVRR